MFGLNLFFTVLGGLLLISIAWYVATFLISFFYNLFKYSHVVREATKRIVIASILIALTGYYVNIHADATAYISFFVSLFYIAWQLIVLGEVISAKLAD